MARWQYGNPKSITGILQYTDDVSDQSDVIPAEDIGKEEFEQITLKTLLSDLLEIYNTKKLNVRVTVEVLNPPTREPRYYLNDDEMMDLLIKDLEESKET